MVHHFAPSLATLAFALPPGTVNWVYQFTSNLANLTTQNGGALTQLGMTELSFVSLMVLISMVVDLNISTMALTLHRQPMHIGNLVQFLLRLIFCLLLESYWTNPLPGASYGFNHLYFPLLSKAWCRRSIKTPFRQENVYELQEVSAKGLHHVERYEDGSEQEASAAADYMV